MKQYMHWLQEFYWICPVCGLKTPDRDIQVCRMRADMDFMKCPGCGNESVV